MWVVLLMKDICDNSSIPVKRWVGLCNQRRKEWEDSKFDFQKGSTGGMVARIWEGPEGQISLASTRPLVEVGAEGGEGAE